MAARRDLALRYVRETDLPLTEVALALGYSELSAFSRAFDVWIDLSPQRYRRLSHA
jgi:AraC-like DNA-binding protein